VGRGNMRDSCHRYDVKRLGVGAIHGIARAQKASVQIFSFAAHAETLRRQARALTTPLQDSTTSSLRLPSPRIEGSPVPS